MLRAAPNLVPTVLGVKALIFYAVLVGVFYASPYMNLFFLLLSFLTVVGLLSTAWTWCNLAGIQGELFETAPTGADAPIPVEVGLRAGRRRFLLRCGLSIGQRRLPVAHSAEVRGEARMTGALAGLPRGIHSVQCAWLETTYPFGLLRARRRIGAPARIVVYPAPADLGDARSRSEALAALCGPTNSLHGEPGPAGLRDYRQGDEPRSVHWKATARRTRLVVREWEKEGVEGLEICLDRRCGRDEFEAAVSWIAALALWARDHKELLLLTSQHHTGCYGENHLCWNDLLTYLAGVDALAPDGPPPPVTSPSVVRLPEALRNADHRAPSPDLEVSP